MQGPLSLPPLVSCGLSAFLANSCTARPPLLLSRRFFYTTVCNDSNLYPLRQPAHCDFKRTRYCHLTSGNLRGKGVALACHSQRVGHEATEFGPSLRATISHHESFSVSLCIVVRVISLTVISHCFPLHLLLPIAFSTYDDPAKSLTQSVQCKPWTRFARPKLHV